MENTESLTISRALAELKLLDKRISKGISGSTFMAIKTKNSNVDSQEFSKQATSSFQSILDLVNRRNLIKQRIVLSNSSTKINVASREYTVAEAIERKNTIQYEKSLLDSLKHQRQHFTSENERLTLDNERKIADMIQREIGKEQKTNVELVVNLQKTLAETNKIEILDPLNVDRLITNLENDIETFESDIDFKLSEANALTKIQVPANNVGLFSMSYSSLKRERTVGAGQW